MKKPLKLPKFKNEDEEREFWSEIDLSEYYEPSDMERVSFPNLKPTTRSISIRMPEYLTMRVKEQANALDIPYQTLMKQYIAKGALKKIMIIVHAWNYASKDQWNILSPVSSVASWLGRHCAGSSLQVALPASLGF